MAGSGLHAAQNTVTAPWLDQDIGAPAVAGSAASTPSGFTIVAGGADIWGRSDQFHFVYQQISGDVDVRARVDSLTAASNWSKAGVMIRASLRPDAAHGYALVSAGKGTAFQRRTAPGGLSTHTAGPAGTAPRWVRLVRQGSRLTSYISQDGSAWTMVASDSIQLGASAYVGLAVTSHNASVATTAAVSQVSIVPLGLPAGESDGDVGAPAVAGSASYGGGTYWIHAGGSDIWGTADQFHYVYQAVSGDVDIAVRVASVSYADEWSKAGVMIRETLDPGSAHAMMLLSAGKGYAFQRRPVAGGMSVNTAGAAGTAPGWVRLQRAGSLLTAYSSADGQNWTVVGSDSITMADTVYVGIAATSHNVSVATDVVADHLTVTQTAPITTPTTTAPTGVGFTASADQATLTSYRIDVFASGADPATATPVATLNAGKPTPDANNDIVVSAPSFFSALAPGNYALTVSALSADGTGRSGAIAFTR